MRDSSELEIYRRAISKNEINELPLRRYEGPISLVRSGPELKAAVRVLGEEPILGFDTETKPSFKKGHQNQPSLLQLAGAEEVFLFQLDQVPLTDGLLDILSDPKQIKAGVAVRDDIKELQELAEFAEGGFVDLGEVARKLKLKTHGLRNLGANLLGFRISKSAQVSDWSKPKLTPQQITYAATDAWISREIYLRMSQLGMLDLLPGSEKGP